ncbi:MAG TPA: alpha/beta hydrolase [Caulobacteraceae bacterium]
MIRHMTMAALAALMTAAPAFAQPAASPPSDGPPWEAYGTPHLVSLPDGRRMNLICMGSGSPVVILESGLGTHVANWGLVQYKIARTTRTCAYERAGLGVNDEGPRPRDANAMDADLSALLRAARLKGPYVLVGHSLGGYPVRLYADLHPREVAGLVLIEPTIDNQKQLIATIAPRPPAPAGVIPPEPCGDAAQAGQLKPGTDIYKACVPPPPPGLPPSVGAAMIAQETRAASYRTLASEAGAIDQDSAETVAHRRSYGDMPLVVLTAGQPAKDPSLSDSQNQAWQALWMKGHNDIASLSSRGQNRVVPGSGHFIQLEQPQAVIEAIDEVVAEARNKAGG